jgi:glycosyltransferase A (GT-A) superfamily protein (DUF2064 family)
MMRENVICIVASYPESGEIKPGLESLLGRAQAAFLARAILLDTISTSLCVPESSVCIGFWPSECRDRFEDLLSLFENEEKNVEIAAMAESIDLIPQAGRNFGERLTNVSGKVFSEGARRAVFISPESPLLQPLILQASFELLKQNQAIVGPTFDGGYYLIGSNGHYPSLFDEIDWNDSCVYRNTVDRLNEAGLTWQELEISYQVNSPEELEQLYFDIDNLRLTGENRIAFHTEKCLANLSR